MDFRTDANLRNAISKHFKKTTSVIVAQRVSSVYHAEKILVLQAGKILNIGSHEELLRDCQPYREIASMQLGETDISGQDKDMEVIYE